MVDKLFILYSYERKPIVYYHVIVAYALKLCLKKRKKAIVHCYIMFTKILVNKFNKCIIRDNIIINNNNKKKSTVKELKLNLFLFFFLIIHLIYKLPKISHSHVSTDLHRNHTLPCYTQVHRQL